MAGPAGGFTVGHVVIGFFPPSCPDQVVRGQPYFVNLFKSKNTPSENISTHWFRGFVSVSIDLITTKKPFVTYRLLLCCHFLTLFSTGQKFL
jgi:hypothetical protein